MTDFRFGVARLKFSDGTIVEVPKQGLVVFVGPNNAGKSATLRELTQRVTAHEHNRPPARALLDADLFKEGSEADLEMWLEANAFRVERSDFGQLQVQIQRPNASAPLNGIKQEWAGDVFPHSGAFFMFYASADNRLGLVGEAGSYDPISDAPSHPLQVLFARPALMESISGTCYEAFGTGLTLSKVWGSGLRLHLGQTDAAIEIPATAEYIEALRAMPLLHEQGDGMRSFMGLMLALVTAQFPMIVVDEPEAFLHPPQARMLGRKLATDTPETTQVFVATHDSDILQGVLDPEDANVTVVRLVREGEVNRASVLTSEQLREIWSDPLLRYSNVLEGLFHKGVVVSESDADSRYYSLLLDARRAVDGSPPHDLLFTQSGGKDRLPVVIQSLRALEIPVVAVADFDVLREEALLARIVESLGGNWSQMSADWRVIHAAVETTGSPPPMTAVRADIDAALDSNEEATLSKRSAEMIRAAIRLDDSWTRAKRGGKSIIPQGEASARVVSLLDALEAVGLFVVPVGELERWEPDIGGHGPSWLGAAVQARRHESTDSEAAQFAARIARRLQ